MTHIKEEQWQSRAHSDTGEEERETVFSEQAGRRFGGREKHDHSLQTSEGCHVEERTKLSYFIPHGERGTGTGSHRQADFLPDALSTRKNYMKIKQEIMSFRLPEEFKKMRCLW